MSNFKLEDSTEFHQIRDRRRQISSLVNRTGNFFPGICNAVSTLIKQMQTETFPSVDTTGRDLMPKRNDIFSQIIRPDYLETVMNEFNLSVAKFPARASAAANYSFSEYIFWIECESPELKKYRAGPANEDPQIRLARTIRRRGEEFYRSGTIDEAVKSFKEADSKNPFDFTVHYQLGLIYFFELADYVSAMEFFNKASKYSSNKSKHVFVHSMAFIGLLLRLMAQCTKNTDLYGESYQALVQAYNADPTYIFSIYALVQCNCIITSNSASSKETVSLTKELIKKERFLLFQLIYDRAFDGFLPELANLCSALTSEAIESASESFRKVDEKMAELSQATKFMSVPSKMTTLRAELDEITGQYSHKNYFDAIIAGERALKLLGSIQEFLQEVTKNRAYFEMRDAVESTTIMYNEEYKEVMRQFIKFEENYNIQKQRLDEINKNYPVAESEKTIKKPKNSTTLTSDEEFEYIPAKPGWHDGKTFAFIKIITGCSSSTLMLAIIMITFLVVYQEINWVPLALGGLNLLCIPMYGGIIAEIYFVIIENKRKTIQHSLIKLEKNLLINKTKIAEIDKALREKYSTIIAARAKVSPFTAGQMLDMGIEGNFDKLRALMP